MNTLNQQMHEIVVSLNRKRLVGATSIIMLAFLFIVGMDVFTLWAFWNHYEIDAGAYVAALLLLICTLFIGWALCVAFYRLHQRDLAFTIDAQGFSFYLPLRFTFLPWFRRSLIPWEEIEWIASSQGGIYTWLSLSLKDPSHYWSLYGNGSFRKWRRDPITRAHINIAQYSLSLSAKQILQKIEENYRFELLTNEVKILH